jgi:serine/threonine protein phosphatase PrpC
LTKDHTIAQLLLSSGEISVEEASDHPGRTRLTRSVGMDGLPLPQARNLTLRAGDLLLLCSDGLTAMISGATIQSILLDGHSLEEKCSRLIAGANEAGGKDNITVVLLSVSDASSGIDKTARRTRNRTA